MSYDMTTIWVHVVLYW